MTLRKPLVLCLLLLSLHSYSQKVIINGKEGNRKLTWSDFNGKPDISSSYFANTHWSIKPRVENIRVKGDSIFIGFFEVVLELDPAKSWVKKDKQSEELLVHEQGHFDGGLLCMKEILAIYPTLKFTKANLNTAIQNLVHTSFKKYEAMMRKYDEETNHSINREQQAKWNLFLTNELKK